MKIMGKITTVTAVVLVLLLCGCSKKSPEFKGGTFVARGTGDGFDVCITFNEQEHTFSFSNDLLSSYLSFGNYIQDGIKLTAKTNDGLYTYVFEIEDMKTLKFRSRESSEVNVRNEGELKPLKDNTIFSKR